jgi:hypothetical protein
VQGALLTMVHGQALIIITWNLQTILYPYPPHGDGPSGSVDFIRERVVVFFIYDALIYIPSSQNKGARVAQWVRSLDLTTHTSLSPTWRGFAPGFVNNKKGALDSQPQVIKLTSCLPMVGGSLRVLRLLPPLKLVAMI